MHHISSLKIILFYLLCSIIIITYFFFFFFSSRRRHTRYWRDWSSDVCSSDLYLRLKQQDVIFIGGSDEHGVPITIRAKKEGITPQDVVDRYHTMIKESFKEFGISFDVYSRTTSSTHRKLASDFFKKLYDEGKLVEQETEQYYDEEAHQFLADRYIMGECPHCHNTGAYGDQCEKCGSDLSPMELINPHSTISGSKPVIRKTKNWYLPLNDYQPWLKQWILDGHKEWRSNVYGQCKSWLDMEIGRASCRERV